MPTTRKLNGQAVRFIRERTGISHGTFANDCQISPGYLTNLEKGRKQPSTAVTAIIAHQLGVSIDDITYVPETTLAA